MSSGPVLLGEVVRSGVQTRVSAEQDYGYKFTVH